MNMIILCRTGIRGVLIAAWTQPYIRPHTFHCNLSAQSPAFEFPWRCFFPLQWDCIACSHCTPSFPLVKTKLTLESTMKTPTPLEKTSCHSKWFSLSPLILFCVSHPKIVPLLLWSEYAAVECVIRRARFDLFFYFSSLTCLCLFACELVRFHQSILRSWLCRVSWWLSRGRNWLWAVTLPQVIRPSTSAGGWGPRSSTTQSPWWKRLDFMAHKINRVYQGWQTGFKSAMSCTGDESGLTDLTNFK